MISANGGLPAHRYTPQVTQRWPQGSEPASQPAIRIETEAQAAHAVLSALCSVLVQRVGCLQGP